MFVLPVLDLQRGVAVHGRGGRRDEYRPVQSVLAPSADPIDLARGVVRHLGLNQLYVADLDAIAGQPPAWSIHQALVDLGLHLWLDVGATRSEQVGALLERLGERVTVVVGLETLSSPADLQGMLECYGGDRLVVSLDLDDGVPRTRIAPWQHDAALTVAWHLIDLGTRRMILLDLSRVGMNGGTGTERLLNELRAESAELEIVCGGGIRDAQALHKLARQGCDGVLLATALHEGRIGRAEVRDTMRDC
jgi:phosphoribosylformimino-5-aminoimidazole carboxamide ribotide isomerase